MRARSTVMGTMGMQGCERARSGAQPDAAVVHRYYDPNTGRYITPDPLGLAGGDPTLFSYAAGNPLRFTDPLGLVVVDYGSLQDCKDGDCGEGSKSAVEEGLRIARQRAKNWQCHRYFAKNGFSLTELRMSSRGPRLTFTNDTIPSGEGGNAVAYIYRPAGPIVLSCSAAQSAEAVASLLIHELSHYVDYQAGGGSEANSQAVEWNCTFGGP